MKATLTVIRNSLLPVNLIIIFQHLSLPLFISFRSSLSIHVLQLRAKSNFEKADYSLQSVRESTSVLYFQFTHQKELLVQILSDITLQSEQHVTGKI